MYPPQPTSPDPVMTAINVNDQQLKARLPVVLRQFLVSLWMLDVGQIYFAAIN